VPTPDNLPHLSDWISNRVDSGPIRSRSLASTQATGCLLTPVDSGGLADRVSETAATPEAERLFAALGF